MPATLLVIGDGQAPDVTRDVLSRASRFWDVRREPSPTIEYRTAAQLLHGLDPASAWDAALVVLSESTPEASLYQLIDRLQEVGTPSVIIEPAKGPSREPFIDARDSLSSDCIFARGGDEAAAVPAMLYAMALRQETVRGMQQRLRAARSIQSEAAAELDRLHDELLLAAQVQRELLPKAMPQVPGTSIGSLFRPAGFVSGDIYDIDRLDEDHIGFFLAHAMGHGVPAALMTLFISGSLPQKEIVGSRYRVIPPAESLAKLNKSMCASRVGSTRFATAVCGQIHVPTSTVRIASAGHPSPLVLNHSGATPIELDGPLLGVFDDAVFQETTITLDASQRLVVHSDGLEEAYSPRNLSNPDHTDVPTRHIDALARIARLAGPIEAQAFIDLLAADLDSQAGSMHQADDVTILAFGVGL
ncbi:MAG: PP2C family protein-serine/threonine phosphatase [Phycisphaerales bacterium]